METLVLNDRNKKCSTRYPTPFLWICDILVNLLILELRRIDGLKWRDLTGNEKLKLLQQIYIPSLFPRLPNGDTIQNIWKKFLEIYDLLRSINILQSSIINILKFVVVVSVLLVVGNGTAPDESATGTLVYRFPTISGSKP